MATVIDFPVGRDPVRLRPAAVPDAAPGRAAGQGPGWAGDGRGRFMGAAELAHRLGLSARQPRTVIDHLRALARERGLPPPVTPRLVNGALVAGERAIHWRALWDRGQVLAWLDDWPGGTGGPALAARMDGARAILAARADQLVAGGRP